MSEEDIRQKANIERWISSNEAIEDIRRSVHETNRMIIAMSTQLTQMRDAIAGLHAMVMKNAGEIARANSRLDIAELKVSRIEKLLIPLVAVMIILNILALIVAIL